MKLNVMKIYFLISLIFLCEINLAKVQMELNEIMKKVNLFLL